MRPASPKKLASWVVSSLLLASAAQAAPTIADWSLQSEGNRESITLHWNEAATYEINEFAQARQVVVVIPGASASPSLEPRLDVNQSRLLRRVRMQEVTLPTGSKGLQVTLQMDEWSKVQAAADGRALTLTIDVPKDRVRTVAPAPVKAKADGLEFTDVMVKDMLDRGFGDANAPATGAGQAPEAADPAAAAPAPAESAAAPAESAPVPAAPAAHAAPAAPLNEYYVPPAAIVAGSESAPIGDDLSQLAVQSKLNEVVRRVDFQGTSLENVLRLISDESELNIMIKTADVTGKTVTLRLRNVTLRQMLDAILKANELGYTIEDGGILRIVPREQVKSTAKETVTRTVPLNWISAAEVRKSLEPFMDSKDGKIEVAATTNQLIIRDVPENVQNIIDLISQIDQPEKQVMIEMRLVNMSESARREFGTRTSWQAQETDPRFAPNANGFVRTQTNSGTSTRGNGSTSTSSYTNDLVSGISGSNANTATQTGTNTNTSGYTESSGLKPVSSGAAGLLGTSAQAFQLSQLTTLSIFGNDFDVDFAINAQEERGEAVTLANPKVLSLNNTKASVGIQRQIPYVSGVNSDNGSIGTIEFKPVGTTVDILPRITNHGWVQMDIEPLQIIDTGDRPQGVPLTDERHVSASVIVKDEQTVALGGLRQFEATSSEAGVPYLLRVPVLSWLFKSQINQQTKTELYLFVTPHVLKDPNPTPYQMALYDKIDYNWDLPDYYFDEVTPRRSADERANPAARKPD